jgi:hypothetical protein
MKRDTFFRISFTVFSVVSILIVGCDNNRKKEDQILGEWEAHWETVAEEGYSELKAENLRMDGFIKFNADGKVEIAAFGYDGCIFSDDTLRNVLNWRIDDSVIRFIDDGDDHGLPYTINKFSRDEMQLTLLKDINLTLRRN